VKILQVKEIGRKRQEKLDQMDHIAIKRTMPSQIPPSRPARSPSSARVALVTSRDAVVGFVLGSVIIVGDRRSRPSSTKR